MENFYDLNPPMRASSTITGWFTKYTLEQMRRLAMKVLYEKINRFLKTPLEEILSNSSENFSNAVPDKGDEKLREQPRRRGQYDLPPAVLHDAAAGVVSGDFASLLNRRKAFVHDVNHIHADQSTVLGSAAVHNSNDSHVFEERRQQGTVHSSLTANTSAGSLEKNASLPLPPMPSLEEFCKEQDVGVSRSGNRKAEQVYSLCCCCVLNRAGRLLSEWPSSSSSR